VVKGVGEVSGVGEPTVTTVAHLDSVPGKRIEAHKQAAIAANEDNFNSSTLYLHLSFVGISCKFMLAQHNPDFAWQTKLTTTSPTTRGSGSSASRTFKTGSCILDLGFKFYFG